MVCFKLHPKKKGNDGLGPQQYLPKLHIIGEELMNFPSTSEIVHTVLYKISFDIVNKIPSSQI